MNEANENQISENQPQENQPQENRPWSKETLIQLLYVVLFIFIYSLAEVVVAAVVLLQFGFKLATGNTNSKLSEFSTRLIKYVYEILKFATFKQTEKPFPFGEWPSGE